MKITDVQVVDLRAPMPPGDWFDGAFVDCLVLVHTDAGITGIAEVDSGPPVVRAFIDPGLDSLCWPSFKSLLVGQDPLGDAEASWDRLYEIGHYNGRRGAAIHAMSGIDIALWDIRGKAAGKPVSALLGTPRRERVRAYATIVRLGRDADEVRRRLDTALALGFRAIKLCAEPDWKDEPDQVEMVCRTARTHVGKDFDLMLDAYACWKNADQVLPHMPLFREAGLRWLEAPVPMDDLDGHARIAGNGIPVGGGDMGLTTRFEYRDMIERGKVDIVQPDVTMVGGLTEFRRVARLAREHKRRIIPHGYKSNILLATNLHFLAQHEADEPLEYSLANSPLRWDLTREKLPVDKDGMVRVPEGPGLGVTLDDATVAKYRVG